MRRLASATSSPSSVKPRSGSVCDVMPSARNGAKLLSRDSVYSKFCLQFSKLLIVSDLDKHHCSGARWVIAMLWFDRALKTKFFEVETYHGC